MDHNTRFAIFIACVIAFFSNAYQVFAQQDTVLWSVSNFTARLSDTLSTNLEAQWRFVDNASAFGQRLIRPSITYRLNDRLTVTGGYVHVVTNPIGGTSFNEHRPWQQVGYTLYQNDYGFIISGRSRIEQRFIESSGDIGWRFRQFLRLEAPIQRNADIKAVAWSEVFYGLNNTEWNQRNAWDQTRHFLGMSVPVSDTLNIEAGYLNQFINGAAHNPMNHALATYFNLSF